MSYRTGVTGTTFTDTGLTNRTTYYYQVAGVTTGGQVGTRSNEVAVIPGNGGPATPTGVAATPGNARVTVSWGAVSGATSYNLYRGTTSTNLVLAQVGITGSPFIDTGLTNGTTYFYQVAGVNANGQGTRSATVSATPLASYLPPAAPTNLSASAGNGQVNLSWSAVTGASSYAVKRGRTSGGPYVTIAASVSSASYQDTGVKNGLTYYYVVTASNSNGESANSNQAGCVPVGQPILATPGNGLVAVRWDSWNDSYIYRVMRATSPDGPYTDVSGPIYPTPSYPHLGYRDANVVNGVTYYYYVAAYDNFLGFFQEATNVVWTMPDPNLTNEPAPTDNIRLYPGNGQIDIGWTTWPGYGYNVWVSTTSGGPYTLRAVVPARDEGGWVRVSVNGLTNGTRYYFVLSTFGSPNSAELSAVPQATISLDHMEVAPASIGGGNQVSISAFLTAMAPSGGASVALTSSAPAVVQVPASLTIGQGEVQGGVWVNTGTVTTPTPVTISGTYAGVTKTTVVTVVPSTLLSVDIVPGMVVANGPPSTGTVTLINPAPAGGATIQLAGVPDTYSQHYRYSLIVPPSVTVPAGQLSAQFPVSATANTGFDNAADAEWYAVRATYAGDYKLSSPFTVTGNYVFSITASPSRVTSGGSSTGTVRLVAPAGVGGLAVTLTTDEQAGSQVVQMPPSVTVPVGQSSASFEIKTDGATQAKDVTLYASTGTGSSYYRTGFSYLHVEPASVALSSIDLTPNPATAGDTVTGTVHLNGAADVGGMNVSLTSSNPAVPVPAQVSIPEGQDHATFTLTTTAVPATTVVTITGKANGVTKQAQLTLNAATFSLTIQPNPVTAEESATGTVYLSDNAPSGGTVIQLHSGTPSVATVPAQVVVGAGTNSASFAVQTFATPADASVQIDATLGASTAQAVLLVKTHVPTVVMNLQAVAGPESVVLTWNRNPWATLYRILITVQGEQVPVEDIPANASSDPVTIRYEDSDVFKGAPLTYTVSALNASGEGASASATATVTLPVPVAPDQFGGAAGDTQVVLGWAEVPDAVSYRVYRRTAPGDPFVEVTTTAETALTDIGLTNGTTYEYAVAAVNPAGTGERCRSIFVTPAPPVRTEQQVLQSATTFYGFVSGGVSATGAVTARFPAPPRIPQPERYYGRRWLVQFGDGAEIQIADETGTIVSYRNLKPSVTTLTLDASQAASRANAILAQAGVSGTFDPAETQQSRRSMAGDTADVWRVGRRRLFSTLPVLDSYVLLTLSGSGTLESLLVADPYGDPDAQPSSDISEQAAMQAAGSLLGTRGFSGTVADSSLQAVVMPNAYWSVTGDAPVPTEPRAAWVCCFTQPTSTPGTAAASMEVWVDCETGTVLGGNFDPERKRAIAHPSKKSLTNGSAVAPSALKRHPKAEPVSKPKAKKAKSKATLVPRSGAGAKHLSNKKKG